MNEKTTQYAGLCDLCEQDMYWEGVIDWGGIDENGDECIGMECEECWKELEAFYEKNRNTTAPTLTILDSPYLDEYIKEFGYDPRI